MSSKKESCKSLSLRMGVFGVIFYALWHTIVIGFTSIPACNVFCSLWIMILCGFISLALGWYGGNIIEDWISRGSKQEMAN